LGSFGLVGQKLTQNDFKNLGINHGFSKNTL
jgi:hypothetical protein